MWHKEYRDYPPDTPLKKQRITQKNGLTGCEMNEPNGWGESFHQYPKKEKKGWVARFFSLFRRKR